MEFSLCSSSSSYLWLLIHCPRALSRSKSCECVSVWVWERDVYSGAAQAWSRKKENQKTGCFLGEQAGSRAGQGKEWAGATLGPELEDWKPFSKERENLATGELQSCPSSSRKHRAALWRGRTVRLGICRNKVIFSSAAWGILFLPFTPPGRWRTILWPLYSIWIRPEQLA